MTFDQIVETMESVALRQPQNLRPLLYILMASDQAGSAIASARAPVETELLALTAKSPMTAELVREFHEAQRMAQGRAAKPQFPIVE